MSSFAHLDFDYVHGVGDIREVEAAVGGVEVIEAEAALGLIVAGDSDMDESVRHGVFAYYSTPRGGQEWPES